MTYANERRLWPRGIPASTSCCSLGIPHVFSLMCASSYVLVIHSLMSSPPHNKRWCSASEYDGRNHKWSRWSTWHARTRPSFKCSNIPISDCICLHMWKFMRAITDYLHNMHAWHLSMWMCRRYLIIWIIAYLYMQIFIHMTLSRYCPIIEFRCSRNRETHCHLFHPKRSSDEYPYEVRK